MAGLFVLIFVLLLLFGGAPSPLLDSGVLL